MFQVSGTARVQNVNECLSKKTRWYLLNHLTFFFFFTKLGIVVYHHELKCHAKRLICYFQCQGHSKDSYDQIWQFLLDDPFATRLSLVVQYHKPECLMKKLDCCVQGQGHSKISKCQWMFVQMISSELLNLLPLNLSQIVFQQDWFTVFKVKVTVKDHIIKICLANLSSEVLILLQPNLVYGTSS